MALTIHGVGAATYKPEVCHRPVVELLPKAIITAAVQYEQHSKMYVDQKDMKAIQQHQAMCKASLQHIEMLIKLGALIEKVAGDESTNLVVEMIANANNEYAMFDGTNSDANKKRRTP